MEKIRGSISLSKFVWSDVYFYRDRAELEIIERAKYQNHDIGILPFMEMLRESLKAVREATKMIRRVCHRVDKDYHHIAFMEVSQRDNSEGQGLGQRCLRKDPPETRSFTKISPQELSRA